MTVEELAQALLDLCRQGKGQDHVHMETSVQRPGYVVQDTVEFLRDTGQGVVVLW